MRQRNEQSAVDVLLEFIPEPPRSPSPRAKRLIFRYQGSQKVMLLVGGCFLLVGTLFTLIFCWGTPSDLYLAAYGEPAAGRVLSAELDYQTEINGEHPTRIRFAYEVAGVPFKDESVTLDGELVEQAGVGAEVPLEVAPDVPQWARLRGTTRNTFGYLTLLVLIFPLVGGALVFFAVRSNRREIRAFRQGRPAMARVVFAGEDSSTTVNGRHPLKVEWEFLVDEEVYRGSLSSMTRLDMEDLMQAQELPIVYLPGKPQTNTVYIA